MEVVVTTWASSISRRPRCRRLAPDIYARLGYTFVLEPYFPQCVRPGPRNDLSHRFASAAQIVSRPHISCARHAKKNRESQPHLARRRDRCQQDRPSSARVAPAPLVSPVFVSVSSSRGRFPSVLSPYSSISCGDDGVEGC